ncbi:MAG: type II toxin-antitoxin system RelE/ParE family toxin [Bacteroidales bacterium]|nr:type II toxin-antitoxin system RelE/ParE family toxin [Bacteroidales bacterium]HOY38503.1 type II toxin-antitoxin system RelE/ParE family toxin [Bacteroidales bacterium]HQP04144.1 type II toxin-antitoxin system RelE/ParE family toxin [Bacteroidales bacterium]
MKNTCKVVWSLEAVENLEAIIHWLEINWSEKEIKKFLIKLEKQIQIIQSQPLSFPRSQVIAARKSVLSKHLTIYYSYTKECIYVLSIFDNRQALDKLSTKNDSY